MKMSIIRSMLIITHELGNASLLLGALLETDLPLLLEPLLQPLFFLFRHPFPQPLLENLPACSKMELLVCGIWHELQ